MAVLVAVGIALRLGAYVKHPSLGLDEARLALNLGTRSYAGLLRPLDFDQSAPLLFLWLQRAVTDLVGMHDWALRLLPLAAGIGLLVLVPRVFRRLLGPGATAAATTLAACSPLLIEYSISVKQYGIEAWLTLLVLGLVLSSRDAGWSGAPASRLIAAGALVPWLMAPAGFVLCGVSACVFADLRKRGEPAKRFLLRGIPCWALSVGLAYYIAYRPASANPYLRHYWSSALLSPNGAGFAARLWAVLNENLWGLALGYPGPPGLQPGIVGILAIAAVGLIVLAGGRSLARAHTWSILLLVMGPLVAAVAASIAGIYPLGLRLTLFAMPLVQLLLFAGLERALAGLSVDSARRAWIAVGCAMSLPLMAVTLLLLELSQPPEDVQTLVKDLAGRRRGEAVYVFARSIPPWAYYTTDWTAPDRRRLALLARIASAGGAAFENAPRGSRVDASTGTGLAYRTAAGPEIYGLATGIEWTPNLGPLTQEPDASWVEREADRVTAVDAPTWILMSRTLASEQALFAELERRGACATYVRELDNATLIRYLPSSARGRRRCASAVRHLGLD